MVWLVAAIGGAVVGWFVIFKASNWMLHRALVRADVWWADSLQAYRLYKLQHPDQEPVATAAGEEGALGIWRDDALAAACAGSLTQERFQALSDAGVNMQKLVWSGTEDQRRQCCLVRPRRWQQVLCAAALAMAAGLSCFFMPNVLAVGSWGVCVVAMAVSVVCDVRARIIPLEACGGLGLAGIVFQFAVQGLEGVLAGLAFGFVVVVVCTAMNRLLRVRCPNGAVGRGDVRCMGALSLVTGMYAASGFTACYITAGVAALVGCALKKLSFVDGLPMAPFLSIWLVCGAVSLLALS